MLYYLLLSWTIYVISKLFILNAFWEQRAALEIGRFLDIEVQHLVLPWWFKYLIIIQIINYTSLFFIAYLSNFYYALIAFGTSFIITVFFPIPKIKYIKINNILEQIKKETST